MSTLNVDLSLVRGKSFELNVKLDLPMMGITSIMGVSGSGKTTLLRAIAGLEQNTNGTVAIDNTHWQTSSHSLPTYKRPVGYVFQEASLFPHLSVKQNLEYALKRGVKNISKDEQAQLIDLLGIRNLLLRMPHQLSGGEKQRVAIARAVFRRPRLLLMDEPLAALDAQRKNEVLPYIETLAKEVDTPILYVSHSIEEVARISDRVIYMDKGSVKKVGDTNEVLTSLGPNAAELGGLGVSLEGRLTQRLTEWQLSEIQTPIGKLLVPDLNLMEQQDVKLYIKANQVNLSLIKPLETSTLNAFEGEVRHVNFDEDSALATITIKINDAILLASITRFSAANLKLSPGVKVWASVKSATLVRY